ncbi:MAG: SDR family NAD(P)-dependent oxidoreductase, partial [Verrucomicrobiota bacterium]
MSSLFDLSGRVALVTGGSKGLGKSMARGFAEHGADVMICSRSEDELKAAQAEIGDGLDVRVEYRVVDMTNREEVLGLANATLDILGKVDILVNNAGSNKPEPIDEITDENWDMIVELNL